MSTHVEFTPRDLEPILEAHQGTKMFEEALWQTESGEDLMHVLHRYIHFNSVFGGGVASLAGEVAVRHDLFRDPEEVVEMLADRSAEVASTIFYAAIDEFGNPTNAHRATHRTMAQATLRAAGNFFEYDSTSLNQLMRPDPVTVSAIEEVLAGYGVNRQMDEMQILRAIGFHIGSELLADEEFCILDKFLQERHPQLVKWLKAATIQINDARLGAYVWIACHTTVEAEHRDAGFAGANRALRYAARVVPPARIKQCMIDGFARFAEVQTGLMDSLRRAPVCS